MNSKQYEIFLVTGGTGGHIFPALSFSKFLEYKGISNLIITDSRGLSYIDINKHKIKIILSSHLKKKSFQFLKALSSLLIGYIQFKILLIQKKPKAIITFGSYTSFMPILSTCLLKKIFGIKIYFHEQNSVIGRVHKLLLFASDKIFVTFKNTKGINKKYFNKVIYSGIPIREEINQYHRKSYKIKDKKKKFNFFIIGGSQGASNLSNSILELFSQLSEEYQKLIYLTLQAPYKDLENLKTKLNKTKINYEIKEFYFNIYDKILKADLCICRSGSSTLNELIRLNTPSILIPLPYATYNHQYYNARYLSDKEGAIIIQEKDLNTKKTLDIIINIINNPNVLNNMFIQLSKMTEINSNELIYNEIYNKK